MQVEKIRELRKKAGLSQKQLGEMLGISNRAVSKWENGVSLPSSRNLVVLFQIFGVPLSAFAVGEQNASEERIVTAPTCDPICGLVQIPCIERNAVAAMRETGEDMSASYKETAEDGLAKIGIE